jgi:PIN domain nuclease of toxin-antitoxin system
VTTSHALAAAALPTHHADPWDRLLVAQARAEQVPILTMDRRIGQYDVETIW